MRDDWHAPDGWTWSHAVHRDGSVDESVSGPSAGWLRPGYAATMPTDPRVLDEFLRARATGSTSQDEAAFVAVGDMLKAEAATPELRAASIRVLGMNPRVTTAIGKDPAGRRALAAVLVEPASPGVAQTLFLDPDTADFLGASIACDGDSRWTYESVVQVREVVNALPESIADSLGTEKVEKPAPSVASTSVGPDGLPTTTLSTPDPTSVPTPYVTVADPTPVPSQTYSAAPTPR